VLAVVVSFGLTMLSLVATRTITEIVSRRIEREAESIDNNALIATDALVATRTNLGKLFFGIDALRTTDRAELVAERLRVLAASRQDMAAHWARYVSIPFYPGERQLAGHVEADIASTEQAIDAVAERMRQHDREGAVRIVEARALPSIERVDDGLERLLKLNGHEARDAAARILASKRPGGLVPEVMSAFFALAMAYFGVRVLTQYLAWAAERSAELERFAGRVAHDIRSPLGSASLALEIAQRGKDVDSKTHELLARARRTMERIARLVDGLLVFATSGGYIVPGNVGDERTNAADVLGGVVEDMRLQAESKHIEISYEASDPAVVVACSPGVFISMVTNLVSNAMKFMGDAVQRRISIAARPIGHDVEVAVSDTGPGIAPELREKVFEPGVRGDTKVPGYGLGLATVRKLAEAHRGSVGVEPSSAGGARFWFHLPLADIQSASASVATS
jgi:signal transduction histidine kinase